MRDIDIINKAVEDAQAVLRDYISNLDRATWWTPSRACSRFWTMKKSPHRSACGRAMGA